MNFGGIPTNVVAPQAQSGLSFGQPAAVVQPTQQQQPSFGFGTSAPGMTNPEPTMSLGITPNTTAPPAFGSINQSQPITSSVAGSISFGGGISAATTTTASVVPQFGGLSSAAIPQTATTNSTLSFGFNPAQSSTVTTSTAAPTGLTLSLPTTSAPSFSFGATQTTTSTPSLFGGEFLLFKLSFKFSIT